MLLREPCPIRFLQLMMECMIMFIGCLSFTMYETYAHQVGHQGLCTAAATNGYFHKLHVCSGEGEYIYKLLVCTSNGLGVV